MPIALLLVLLLLLFIVPSNAATVSSATAAHDHQQQNNDHNGRRNNQETCSLSCVNGGWCEKGRAEFGYAREFQDDLDNMIPLSEQDDRAEDIMYCGCPEGFTGIRCEIALTVCDGSEERCFNGEQCKRAQSDLGMTYYHCQCDASESDLSSPYALSFCQHSATTFCAVHEDGREDKTGKHTFCTNGGKCKAYVRAHHE